MAIAHHISPDAIGANEAPLISLKGKYRYWPISSSAADIDHHDAGLRAATQPRISMTAADIIGASHDMRDAFHIEQAGFNCTMQPINDGKRRHGKSRHHTHRRVAPCHYRADIGGYLFITNIEIYDRRELFIGGINIAGDNIHRGILSELIKWPA